MGRLCRAQTQANSHGETDGSSRPGAATMIGKLVGIEVRVVSEDEVALDTLIHSWNPSKDIGCRSSRRWDSRCLSRRGHRQVPTCGSTVRTRCSRGASLEDHDWAGKW